MNLFDVVRNMVDELERARDIISKEYEEIYVLTDEIILLDDIDREVERYYDYRDSFQALLEDSEVN